MKKSTIVVLWNIACLEVLGSLVLLVEVGLLNKVSSEVFGKLFIIMLWSGLVLILVDLFFVFKSFFQKK